MREFRRKILLLKSLLRPLVSDRGSKDKRALLLATGQWSLHGMPLHHLQKFPN